MKALLLSVLVLSGCGAGYARCMSDAQCPTESRCEVQYQLCVSIPDGRVVESDAGTPGTDAGTNPGCNAQTCPSGCCANGGCTPRALNACGSAGATCVVCSATQADNCASSGDCRCGNKPACGPSTSCIAGNCVVLGCNASTCAGCCRDATHCEVAAKDHCGAGGSACVDCAKKGDTCGADGACHCGSGPACFGNKECRTGMCK